MILFCNLVTVLFVVLIILVTVSGAAASTAAVICGSVAVTSNDECQAFAGAVAQLTAALTPSVSGVSGATAFTRFVPATDVTLEGALQRDAAAAQAALVFFDDTIPSSRYSTLVQAYVQQQSSVLSGAAAGAPLLFPVRVASRLQAPRGTALPYDLGATMAPWHEVGFALGASVLLNASAVDTTVAFVAQADSDACRRMRAGFMAAVSDSAGNRQRLCRDLLRVPTSLPNCSSTTTLTAVGHLVTPGAAEMATVAAKWEASLTPNKPWLAVVCTADQATQTAVKTAINAAAAADPSFLFLDPSAAAAGSIVDTSVAGAFRMSLLRFNHTAMLERALRARFLWNAEAAPAASSAATNSVAPGFSRGGGYGSAYKISTATPTAAATNIVTLVSGCFFGGDSSSAAPECTQISEVGATAIIIANYFESSNLDSGSNGGYDFAYEQFSSSVLGARYAFNWSSASTFAPAAAGEASSSSSSSAWLDWLFNQTVDSVHEATVTAMPAGAATPISNFDLFPLAYFPRSATLLCSDTESPVASPASSGPALLFEIDTISGAIDFAAVAHIDLAIANLTGAASGGGTALMPGKYFACTSTEAAAVADSAADDAEARLFSPTDRVAHCVGTFADPVAASITVLSAVELRWTSSATSPLGAGFWRVIVPSFNSTALPAARLSFSMLHLPSREATPPSTSSTSSIVVGGTATLASSTTWGEVLAYQSTTAASSSAQSDTATLAFIGGLSLFSSSSSSSFSKQAVLHSLTWQPSADHPATASLAPATFLVEIVTTGVRVVGLAGSRKNIWATSAARRFASPACATVSSQGKLFVFSSFTGDRLLGVAVLDLVTLIASPSSPAAAWATRYVALSSAGASSAFASTAATPVMCHALASATSSVSPAAAFDSATTTAAPLLATSALLFARDATALHALRVDLLTPDCAGDAAQNTVPSLDGSRCVACPERTLSQPFSKMCVPCEQLVFAALSLDDKRRCDANYDVLGFVSFAVLVLGHIVLLPIVNSIIVYASRTTRRRFWERHLCMAADSVAAGSFSECEAAIHAALEDEEAKDPAACVVLSAVADTVAHSHKRFQRVDAAARMILRTQRFLTAQQQQFFGAGGGAASSSAFAAAALSNTTNRGCVVDLIPRAWSEQRVVSAVFKIQLPRDEEELLLLQQEQQRSSSSSTATNNNNNNNNNDNSNNNGGKERGNQNSNVNYNSRSAARHAATLSAVHDEILHLIQRHDGFAELVLEDMIVAHWASNLAPVAAVALSSSSARRGSAGDGGGGAGAGAGPGRGGAAAGTSLLARSSVAARSGRADAGGGGGAAGAGGAGAGAGGGRDDQQQQNDVADLRRACHTAHQIVTSMQLKKRGVTVAAGISHCNDAQVGVAGTETLQKIIVSGASLREAAHLARLAEKLNVGITLPWVYEQWLGDTFVFRFAGKGDLGAAMCVMWVAELIAPQEDRMWSLEGRNVKQLIVRFNDAMSVLSRGRDIEPCQALLRQPRLPAWLAAELKAAIRAQQIPSHKVGAVW